ncbi:hypothetical protein Nekkels1_26 [Cellulophaga phage Nekkels_1]|uniref:Uncharacterized protein n=1 Tax=Cellulophaga phage Nekkels_1 TaxID=2745692 RepID=A0A8E4UXG0_9CAUD|nr:hypothetical protein M1M31_gp26 [Cellulophaga phage Nekkels_1]QQO97026.1 hypothetical protein Nekkels1_26 [Cellulophaga phage Nekkels_1]QQO97119.1 hypothetical protein Nekkels2_26 [Cellulophaga phage Nekkels_2]
MTTEEFRISKDYGFDYFKELTDTGIKPNYVNIEKFAKEYHEHISKSKITTDDYGKEFVVNRNDLVEIEEGTVVILLEINSNGRHEFMNESNEIYYLDYESVKRKNKSHEK